VLADLLAEPGRLGVPVGPEVLGDVRAALDEAATAAAGVGGWSDDEPLRLPKGLVTWLLRCPRRALTADTGGAGDISDLVLGLVVDAAAKLATLGARRPVTVDAAVAFLAAQGDDTAADHLAALGPDAAALRGEAAARIGRLVAAWPAVPGDWWPRVEEPVRARLAGGAVTLAGRLDVLLGGPPTGRPGVVVEVKGGSWYDGMRADGHLYALLVSLRDGVAPAAVVTVVADGTTHVEAIRPALVRHAGERVEQALGVAARLAAGEPAEALPGPGCHHCPALADCAPGRARVADRLLAPA
jgi:hypothetical protein